MKFDIPIPEPCRKIVKGVMSIVSRREMDGFGGSTDLRQGNASVCGQPISRKGKSPQHKARDVADLRRDCDDLKRKLDESNRELKQAHQALEEYSAKLKKATSENNRLTVVVQTLEKQMSDLKMDLEEKVKRARNLEDSSPALLDWVQSVIGYAENKALFPSDADELAQFRADAKRLPTLLRLNKIECNNTPPDEGIGFVHKRDARITEGREVLAAPMLLRNGVIISEGIVLVPDVSECPQKIPNIGSEQGHTEVSRTEKTSSDAQSTKTDVHVNAPQTQILFDKEQLRGHDTEEAQRQDAITASISANPVDTQTSKAGDNLVQGCASSSVCVSDSTGGDDVDTSSATTTSMEEATSPTNPSGGKLVLKSTDKGEQNQDMASDSAGENLTCGQVSEIVQSVSSGDSAANKADVGQQSPWEFDV